MNSKLKLVWINLIACLTILNAIGAPYVVPGAIPGKCYVRYTGYLLNGNPHSWIVNWEDSSHYQNGAGGSWTMDDIKTMDFELYGKKPTKENKIYCGFGILPSSGGNLNSFPFFDEVPSGPDSNYIGVGRYFLHLGLGGFNPLSCNTFGGLCGESSHGKVYRVGCNRFKIFPHDINNSAVYIDNPVVAGYNDAMKTDTNAQPWYSWFTSLMQQIDQGITEDSCVVKPSIDLKINGQNEIHYNPCQGAIENTVITLNQNIVLSDLFSFKLSASIYSLSGTLIDQKEVILANPNPGSFLFSVFAFNQSTLDQFHNNGGYVKINATQLFVNDTYQQSNLVTIKLSSGIVQLDFSLSPNPTTAPDTYFVTGNQTPVFSVGILNSGLNSSNAEWSSSCSGCTFASTSGGANYNINGNYGMHSLTFNYNSSDPNVCYRQKIKNIYVYQNLQLEINGISSDYRFKGCNANENLEDISIKIKGSLEGYQSNQFSFKATVKLSDGNEIGSATFSPLVNLNQEIVVQIKDFSFNQNILNNLKQKLGSIIVELSVPTAHGVIINKKINIIVDNKPVQLDFLIDHESNGMNSYVFNEGEQRKIKLVPNVLDYPNASHWSTNNTLDNFSEFNPTIFSFNSLGDKSVTFNIDKIDDYTCFIPITKNFTVIERLKINLYPNPLGNESQLKLKTNNSINDLKINFYSVDGRQLKALNVGAVTAFEEKVLLLGKEITDNSFNEGIFLVVIESKEYSYKETFRIAKFNDE